MTALSDDELSWIVEAIEAGHTPRAVGRMLEPQLSAREVAEMLGVATRPINARLPPDVYAYLAARAGAGRCTLTSALVDAVRSAMAGASDMGIPMSGPPAQSRLVAMPPIGGARAAGGAEQKLAASSRSAVSGAVRAPARG